MVIKPSSLATAKAFNKRFEHLHIIFAGQRHFLRLTTTRSVVSSTITVCSGSLPTIYPIMLSDLPRQSRQRFRGRIRIRTLLLQQCSAMLQQRRLGPFPVAELLRWLLGDGQDAQPVFRLHRWPFPYLYRTSWIRSRYSTEPSCTGDSVCKFPTSAILPTSTDLLLLSSTMTLAPLRDYVVPLESSIT